MEFDVVIGLEVHVELNTKTKVFCACKNVFGGEPNTHCCPVCIGLPGALPRLNKEAVNKTIIAGISTNCTISNKFGFARKNYYYPDLPKAYQISQDETPICRNGFIEIEGDDGKPKKIRINRIHLEEDAGKLTHSNLGESYVDYNRCGVPLIETVSEPDISSAKEAIAYLNQLKDLYKSIGVSDCKMEQGSLRCDVNISLKPKGSIKLGNRTEMKNINSFKAIERAINYEVARQKSVLENGGKIEACTMRWDDEKNENFVMRSKEGANDYRFFPEPDIYATEISASEISALKSQIPVLPNDVKNRLINEFGLGDYDAKLISRDKSIWNLFFDSYKLLPNAKVITNWITSEVNKKLNSDLEEEIIVKISAKELTDIIKLYTENKISQQSARDLIELIWNGDKSGVDNLVATHNMQIVSDTGAVEKLVDEVLTNNPKAVADYKAGNTKVMAFLVGQAMKASKGKADSKLVNSLLLEKLK